MLFFYCIINPSFRLHHILHGCKTCFLVSLLSSSARFTAFLCRSVAIWRGCDSIVVQAFITTRFSVFVPCCLHGLSVCCDLQSPVFIERSCLNWDQKDKRSSSIPASFLTKKKLPETKFEHISKKSPQRVMATLHLNP